MFNKTDNSEPILGRNGLTAIIFVLVPLIYFLQTQSGTTTSVNLPKWPAYHFTSERLDNDSQLYHLENVIDGSGLGLVWYYNQDQAHSLDANKQVLKQLSANLTDRSLNVLKRQNHLDRGVIIIKLSPDPLRKKQELETINEVLTSPIFEQTQQYSLATVQQSWRDHFLARNLIMVSMGAESFKESQVIGRVVSLGMLLGRTPKIAEGSGYDFPIEGYEDLFLLQWLQLSQRLPKMKKGTLGWSLANSTGNMRDPFDELGDWSPSTIAKTKRTLAAAWVHQLNDPERQMIWLTTTLNGEIYPWFDSLNPLNRAFETWIGVINAQKLETQIQSYQERWQEQQSP